MALAGVVQWIECQPANQRAQAWVAGQAPSWGRMTGNHTFDVPLPLFSFPSPFSKINKIFFKKTPKLCNMVSKSTKLGKVNYKTPQRL